MNPHSPFRSKEQVRIACARLGDFAAAARYDELPVTVRNRLPLVLTDLAGVTVAGMRTSELVALVNVWSSPPGEAPIPGTVVRSAPETAAYLGAVGACCLELDEGNKYAAGHPAAHVYFAAVAATQLAESPVSGERFLTAVALGYEVSARFGRATTRDGAWHPHGHWGATGAACAAALIMGATPLQVAAAIDASTALMHVTPWATVLDGDFTRNMWIAGANSAGLQAARLAVADLVDNRGNAHHSLGGIMGTLDAASLIHDLGERWLVTEGYVKLHAACSYTHPAIDLVQALRAAHGWQTVDVRAVRVRTHSLAEPLLGRHPHNRLQAMFSLPFVVSTAIVNETVDPQSMEPGSPAFLAAEEFSPLVQVEIDQRLDAYLPDVRCTEVRIELVGGDTLELAAPNPIGDAHHFPLDIEAIQTKIAGLIGASDTARIVGAVDALRAAPDARLILEDLALA